MRILFVRLNAIGDVVQAAAAVQLYRAQFPEVSITWVVDQQLASFVAGFKVADHVIGIDASKFFSGHFVSRAWNLLKSMVSLALTGRYDAVYCAHPDWRYGLLTSLVKASRRVSPKSMTRFKTFIPNRNRVFEYFRLLTNKDAGQLQIDSALEAIGSTVLATSEDIPSERIELPREYVALIPGGARNILRDDPLRRWPIEHYAELARRLSSNGYEVVILGGPNDKWVSSYFSEVPVFDIVGKTSLRNMVGVLDKASCVIAHDSGPLHLTSITSSPLVAIFGPTPANAVLSFSRPNTIILRSENRVSCSPCYDGQGYADCKKALCLESISVEKVVGAVDSLLKAYE